MRHLFQLTVRGDSLLCWRGMRQVVTLLPESGSRDRWILLLGPLSLSFSSPGHQAMEWWCGFSHHNSETSSQACPKIFCLGSSCSIWAGNSHESGPFSGWTLSDSWSWVNSFHLQLYLPRVWMSCLFGSTTEPIIMDVDYIRPKFWSLPYRQLTWTIYHFWNWANLLRI